MLPLKVEIGKLRIMVQLKLTSIYKGPDDWNFLSNLKNSFRIFKACI